jgi:hypothetical protein
MKKQDKIREKNFLKSIFFLHMQIRMFIVPVYLMGKRFKESSR